MKKGIEAFKRIKENTTCYVSQDYDMTNYDADVEVVEKELKALEIINNKRVDVASFKAIVSTHPKKALEYYNQSMGFNPRRLLKQEEFELLKEVLAND